MSTKSPFEALMKSSYDNSRINNIATHKEIMKIDRKLKKRAKRMDKIIAIWMEDPRFREFIESGRDIPEKWDTRPY